MATLVLSAAGAAFGGGFGGSLFGLSSLALGKAVGASVGSLIDQKLLGAGSAPVETGRLDRLRVMGSSEGAPLPRVFGRMRVAGQLIWSSRFLEDVSSQRVGGKGSRAGQSSVDQYSYSVSLAVALCEGEVMRIGRIWADGQPVSQASMTLRLHTGSEEQLPDPLIAAIEGDANAPAYRGTAYVVFEDLDLAPFGNRIPQFNIEVFRRPASVGSTAPRPAALDIQAVALVPGTGEYSLAAVPVSVERGRGDTILANVHNDRGVPDLVASLDQLDAELPACRAISLVVSWFGDDLRMDRCSLYPAVEQTGQDGDPIGWSAAAVRRADARVVSRTDDGRPIFGGTPADEAVAQAIRQMAASGKAVMFYPFILMDILGGNSRQDPWNPGTEQPPVPWRGRITLSVAPGLAGSPDQSTAAGAEVDAFFGTAAVDDFVIAEGRVNYHGPDEWSYRRFILHYAHLCAAAGGVDAFCIGSEMRGLTQVRDGRTSYPAVRALRRLAEDVRSVLGPAVKIGYAADWSEYFGHHPSDGSGDVIFHLDPLWSDPVIDFVGIDNYMPLSDWRDEREHRDAAAGSIYDLDYLGSNVAGGEGFDWYYPDATARSAQERRPIVDGNYGEPWTFRYKDLMGWWSNPHFDRVAGSKQPGPTGWQPRSKPFWFTELGCPAVDKGTNQPNVFYDPKSSESFLPYHSSGQRDDFIQGRYLQAIFAHWSEAARNPVSEVYGGSMVDMERAFVWAWDARPWPDFPSRLDAWSDGGNYEGGHWLNGRIAAPSLADIVVELCERCGVRALTTEALYGSVQGYVLHGIETARQSLQPLLLAFGIDFHVEGVKLVARSRSVRVDRTIPVEGLASVHNQPSLARTRSAEVEAVGRVALSYVQSDADYLTGAAEATAEVAEPSTSETSLPIVFSPGEAECIAGRWLAESRVARETVVVSLPLSALAAAAGDVFALQDGDRTELLRIDQIVDRGSREITAVRVEPQLYDRPVVRRTRSSPRVIVPESAVHVEFLDLPLLSGDEVPHAPHAAALKRPWAGPVALYASGSDSGYVLNRVLDRPAVIGELLDPMPAAYPGLWAGWGGRVRLDWATVSSASATALLNGANSAAIRSGPEADWEVIQFATAELVSEQTYRLDTILRGQCGTDGVMPPTWPSGSVFVLLDGGVGQIDLPLSARGLTRHFRFGPARVGHTDPSYRHRLQAFAGVGLRPYRPAHFTARRDQENHVVLRWVRRTRIDGDTWEGSEVPVGEESLAFDLKIIGPTGLLRRVSPTGSGHIYTVAEQTADGAAGMLVFELAQVSERFGPGPYGRTTLAATNGTAN